MRIGISGMLDDPSYQRRAFKRTVDRARRMNMMRPTKSPKDPRELSAEFGRRRPHRLARLGTRPFGSVHASRTSPPDSVCIVIMMYVGSAERSSCSLSFAYTRRRRI